MSYQYDVFISYSSADKLWAEKLFAGLNAKGITPFLDRKRLVAGAQWEPQLAMALQSSQHIIVLWSGNAEESSWVRRELGVFEAIVDPTASGQIQGNRRLIFLLLEGQNAAYASMQMINDLKEANAYAGGIDSLNQGLWLDVMGKVADVIQKDELAMRIPLAILSMRKDDIKQINPSEATNFGPSLSTLLADFGIGTMENLMQNYGEQRADWRPFGSLLNIRQILENLKDDINKKTNWPKFRWEPIDNAFWTSIDVAKRERDKLLSNLSMIVIDPISLYDSDVYDRLVFLSNCFHSENAVIVVLTPFSIPQSIVNLRALIENRGTPFFDRYFDPPIPNEESYANCGVNIGDDKEFKRLLRFSLGHYARKVQPTSRPDYLRL